MQGNLIDCFRPCGAQARVGDGHRRNSSRYGTRVKPNAAQCAHRKAIRQWVTGGGNLWLIGDRGLSVSTRLLGNGRILHVPSLDGLPEEEKKLKLEEFINLHEKGNCYPEITSAAPYYFSAPSTTLGLGLIIFAVLVGPLSLFLWAPAGKRQRLFLLIPAISVGFSLLLLLLILAGDGTGGTGSREVLIQVNPQDHSALISQNQICKTSVLLNNTFQLPENAGITGARMSKARGSIKEKPIEGASRQGEECGGKWFTSRSTLQHRIIMPVSTRAALTLLETRPGGAPVFQSTFPGTLNGLTYRDASGKYWTLEQLPPGRKMQASPFLPEEEPDGPPPLHFRASMEPAGPLKAVNNASFVIRQGQVVGLIGSNGAGKTTLMRMLATLEMPDSGHIRLNGADVVNHPELARSRIGWMPDYFHPYKNTSVREYLDFFARAWAGNVYWTPWTK